MTKKQIIALISVILAIVIISLSAVYFIQSNNSTAKNNQSNQVVKKVEPIKEITYAGKEGVTALALLQKAAKVEMSGSGEMAFVNSINGITADSAKNEFWSFNVNGEPATVGAGSYITKNNDTITWKIDSF